MGGRAMRLMSGRGVGGLGVEKFLKKASFLCVAALELELELIHTQMAQKPMLRAEVYARALHPGTRALADSSTRLACRKPSSFLPTIKLEQAPTPDSFWN